MNYASQILIKEHAGILQGLDILEAMTGHLCEQQDIDPGDVYDMIQFLNTYVDRFHHEKEEKLYYPVLEKHVYPVRTGAIRQIMDENALSRQYFEDLDAAVRQTEPETDTIVAAATVYIELMRGHIAREDADLFPLGDRLIPEQDQQKLLQAFDRHERDCMDSATQKMLYDMLHTFERKYLTSVV